MKNYLKANKYSKGEESVSEVKDKYFRAFGRYQFDDLVSYDLPGSSVALKGVDDRKRDVIWKVYDVPKCDWNTGDVVTLVTSEAAKLSLFPGLKIQSVSVLRRHDSHPLLYIKIMGNCAFLEEEYICCNWFAESPWISLLWDWKQDFTFKLKNAK